MKKTYIKNFTRRGREVKYSEKLHRLSSMQSRFARESIIDFVGDKIAFGETLEGKSIYDCRGCQFKFFLEDVKQEMIIYNGEEEIYNTIKYIRIDCYKDDTLQKSYRETFFNPGILGIEE